MVDYYDYMKTGNIKANYGKHEIVVPYHYDSS